MDTKEERLIDAVMALRAEREELEARLAEIERMLREVEGYDGTLDQG